MKVTRFVLLSLLLCVVFISSAIAEEAKKADSLNNDALGDAQVALVAKDYKKAVELLTPLAEANNVRAKALLAPLIFRGTGVDKDTNKGIAMIMDAASQGDVDAQKIAVDLNHELASVGDEKAMYNMGYMCLNGWGGEIESGQCLKWLEDAANMGHTNSAKFLAHIYKNGKYGITADQSKAEEWTQKAQQPPQQPK
jgi:TPR repeat protein